MQRKFLLGCVFLFFFSSNTLFGQTSTAANDADFLNLTPSLENSSSENWSFYLDEENHIYYIDFETIQVNLSEIVVVDENEEIITRADVSDLPVNSIFELDCSKYSKGKYTVELRSYTETLKKVIFVK